MKRTYLAAACLLMTVSAAIAEPSVHRIRGSISAISDKDLSIHSENGPDQKISVNQDTKYLKVVRSSLDKVEPGSFIGTATKSVGSNQVALEVLIFPAEMRGTGEGHYDWDDIADTTRSGGSSTRSSMTNGNVAAVAAKNRTVKSSMTNGNVSSADSQNGTKQITVTYKDGQQVVLVPPTAPIVTFQPGAKADAAAGASVFIVAATSEKDGTAPVAQLVAIGVDGIKPPM